MKTIIVFLILGGILLQSTMAVTYGEDWEEIDLGDNKTLIRNGLSNVLTSNGFQPFNSTYSFGRDGRFVQIRGYDYNVTLDWGVITKQGAYRDSDWILEQYPSTVSRLHFNSFRSFIKWDFNINMSHIPLVVRQNVRGFYFTLESAEGNINWNDVSLIHRDGYDIIKFKDTYLSFEEEMSKGVDITINRSHIIYENITAMVVDGEFTSDPVITHKKEIEERWEYTLVNNSGKYEILNSDSISKTRIEQNKITLTKWDESEIVISIPSDSISYLEDHKIQTIQDNISNIYYQKDKDNFEWEIHIIEDMDTNYVTFPIDLKNSVCTKQLPLNQEHNNYTHCNETNCWDFAGEGNTSYRPENVVNSYVCFHPTKRNNEWGTGRFGMIFRPNVTLANDTTLWCDQIIENGNLTIICPNTFTKDSIIDPTFGYEGEGVSVTIYPGRTICHTYDPYNATSGDTVTTVHVYTECTAGGSPCPLGGGIYDFDGTDPVNLLGHDTLNTFDFQGLDWFEVDLDLEMNATTEYVACMADDGSDLEAHYDSGGGNGNAKDYDAFFAASYTDDGGSGAWYSVYATYTEAAPAVDNAPNITLFNPANGTNTSNTQQNISCNVTDDNQIDNTTLYVWNTTGVFNTTLNISTGTSLNYTWNISNFVVDTYLWNCYSVDNNSNGSWAASNFTFFVYEEAAVDCDCPTDGTNWAVPMQLNCITNTPCLNVGNISYTSTGTWTPNETINFSNRDSPAASQEIIIGSAAWLYPRG